MWNWMKQLSGEYRISFCRVSSILACVFNWNALHARARSDQRRRILISQVKIIINELTMESLWLTSKIWRISSSAVGTWTKLKIRKKNKIQIPNRLKRRHVRSRSSCPHQRRTWSQRSLRSFQSWRICRLQSFNDGDCNNRRASRHEKLNVINVH